MTQKPPPSYWATMIAFGSLVMSGLGLVIASNKADAEGARRLEQRLCRMEALQEIGECKR